MGGNSEFFENFERKKYLKLLPSMQRVKEIRQHSFAGELKRHCFVIWMFNILSHLLPVLNK